MVIKRNTYLDRIIAAKHDGFVKIITGIRRCGKSYLLMKLFGGHLKACGVPSARIVRVALDDDKNVKLRNPVALSSWIRSRIRSRAAWHYVFIDEIQMCEEVEIDVGDAKTKLTFYDVLNGLLKYPKVDVYVTGSNSKTLSSDIATNFRDRGEEIHLHPLTFSEFLQTTKKDEYSAFREYMTYGGMPGCVLKHSQADKRAYLDGLFRKVFLKDIVERHGIRDTAVLETLVNVLCSTVGGLTNPNRLVQTMNSQAGMKTNSPTVQNYIGYLVEAFLFRKAERYDVRGKKYLEFPSKYYVEDVGLRNARLNFREQEEAHLMENVIFNELIARGYSVDVGVVELSERKDGQSLRRRYEIDFVVNTGFSKIYIQSAYSIADADKRRQETKSLEKSGDFFKKIVVTAANESAWEDENGIMYVGVIPFLTNPNILGAAISGENARSTVGI